jgi:hypothetical protein
MAISTTILVDDSFKTIIKASGVGNEIEQLLLDASELLNATTIRVINESSTILGELYLHSIGDSITIEKFASDSISIICGGLKAHALGSPRS